MAMSECGVTVIGIPVGRGRGGWESISPWV